MATKTPHKKPKKKEPLPDVMAEYAGLARDVNVRQFVLDVVGKGVPDVDVSESMISGEIHRSIDGASEVTITVHDQGRNIIQSGILQDSKGRLRAVDVELDGMWFRLTGISKQGDDLSIKMEDRRINRLRTKMGPRKAASRAKVTRAQYILSLVRSVKADKRAPVFIYELKKKQKVAPATSAQKKKTRKSRDKQQEKDAERGRGFPDNLHIDGVNKGQLDNIEVYLDECELLRASELAVLSGLVAGFGESQWSKAAKDWKTGRHQGVFQANQDFNGPGGPIPPSDLEGQSHHYLVGGRSFRAGGAIRAARDHPDWTPGAIALYVEVSDASGASHYDKHIGKARKILRAWGGATGGNSDGSQTTTDKTYYKTYEFKVDEDENYWDAIQRMADEVKWRAFVSGKKFFYVPEEALIQSRSRYRFSEDTPGIDNIDFDWDYRKRSGRATVTCRIDAWAAPPGSVVEIEHMGPVSEGRWLVEDINRNLFSPEATISLKRKMDEHMEPRPEQATRSSDSEDGGDAGGDGTGDGLFYECDRISDANPPYDYGGAHGPQLENVNSRDAQDCSSSCSLALYRAGLFGDRKVAIVSGAFASSWGKPGKGSEFTVWANGGHVWIEFHGDNEGWRFDTSPKAGDSNSEHGPRLRKGSRSTAGFTPRHSGDSNRPRPSRGGSVNSGTQRREPNLAGTPESDPNIPWYVPPQNR